MQSHPHAINVCNHYSTGLGLLLCVAGVVVVVVAGVYASIEMECIKAIIHYTCFNI